MSLALSSNLSNEAKNAIANMMDWGAPVGQCRKIGTIPEQKPGNQSPEMKMFGPEVSTILCHGWEIPKLNVSIWKNHRRMGQGKACRTSLDTPRNPKKGCT